VTARLDVLTEGYADDQAQLEVSRAQLLALRPALVVPGHGRAFVPG
jgi:glyoxylase-like metal-dependent hydrolase (beta-lactamase superfamily II)